MSEHIELERKAGVRARSLRSARSACLEKPAPDLDRGARRDDDVLRQALPLNRIRGARKRKRKTSEQTVENDNSTAGSKAWRGTGRVTGSPGKKIQKSSEQTIESAKT